jgi:hypothetical protein
MDQMDLKHIEAASHGDINGLLDHERGLYIGARLREAHATELQQKLLSNIGRIGLTAPLPATFSVSVDVFYPDTDRRPIRLPVPELDRSGGVRIVGRSKDQTGKLVPEMRLVITESSCEAIYGAIQELDLSLVNAGARTAVEYLRGSEDLILALGTRHCPTRADRYRMEGYPISNRQHGRKRTRGETESYWPRREQICSPESP